MAHQRNDDVYKTKEATMNRMKHAIELWALVFVGLSCLLCSAAKADDPWVVFQGGNGPGRG